MVRCHRRDATGSDFVGSLIERWRINENHDSWRYTLTAPLFITGRRLCFVSMLLLFEGK